MAPAMAIPRLKNLPWPVVHPLTICAAPITKAPPVLKAPQPHLSLPTRPLITVIPLIFFVFPCPFLLLAILLILCFLPPHLDADTSNSNTNNTTTTTKVVKPKRNKLRKYTNTTKRLVFLVIFIIHDHDMCNSSCKTTKNEMVLQVWLLLQLA